MRKLERDALWTKLTSGLKIGNQNGINMEKMAEEGTVRVAYTPIAK